MGPRIREIEHGGQTYKLPSVTTVIDRVLAAPELVEWRINTACEDVISQADKLFKEIGDNGYIGCGTFEAELRARIGSQWKDKKIAGIAAGLGTRVHSLIQRHLKEEMGRSLEPLEGESSERAVSAYEAWQRWRATQDFRPIEVEKTVYDIDNMVSGQLDCIAMHNGYRKLIDWKTSKGLYYSHHLQVSAYWMCEKFLGNHGIIGALIVRVPKDGGEVKDVVEIDEKELHRLAGQFKVLRQMYDEV